MAELSATAPEALENALSNAPYLLGEAPTAVDFRVFNQFKGNAPERNQFPNLFHWYAFLNNYTPAAKSGWPEPKQEEAKPAEEEDFDVFAEDPNAEAEAAKLKEAKKEETKKQGPIAKSLVIFAISPQTTYQSLDQIAKEVLNIKMEGLEWKTEYKKLPVAYGIEKLHIGCVVVDDLVSTDLIAEKVLAFEGDYEDDDEETEQKITVHGNIVQSCEIAAFNKL